MGCFDGYLFLTDMDGTLTDREKLSQENIDAIRFFQQEGGLFTLASGRAPGYLRDYAEKIGLKASVIGINGTVIYDLEKDELLFSDCLDEGAIEVVEYAIEHYEGILAESTTYSMEEWAGIYELKDQKQSFREYAKTLPSPWYKLILIVRSDVSEKILLDLRERFGDRYNFERSWPEGIEMHSKGSGKDVCLKRLKEYFGDRIHTTVAAGDYENDLPMIQAADIGYAVGNAIASVKEAADRITVSCDQHSIAAIIQELYKEKQ